MSTRGGRQHIPRPPTSRPGRPAPWAHLDEAGRRFPLAEVGRRLAELPEARTLPEAGARPAAVLVPLFEEHGEARVILTKRPETMPSHRGEIAFPGGRFDPTVDIDLRDTALREAEEEVGLGAELVEVVARLDSIATVGSGFVITPFVAFLPGGRPSLVPDAREVVKVFDVALSELMHEEAYREERWDLWADDLPVHFYELPGETVWGATARILTAFLAHLVAGS